MKKQIILILITVIANVKLALGWGERGHEIVAQIARVCLAKNIVDSVQFYLGETTFEEAAVWMDKLKDDRSYDYLKSTHFINLEKDKVYVKVEEPNIINKLDVVIEELKNRKALTRNDIKLRLLILFHLVGDLHQPLHVGYGADKGGNTVEVDFMRKRTNLHKVWDTGIIEEQNINTQSCIIRLNRFSPKEKIAIQEINTIEWMKDSRRLLDKAYKVNGNTIDNKYMTACTPIIEKQLAKAGLRLCSVLNTIYRGTFSK